jgi:hypothetical protein
MGIKEEGKELARKRKGKKREEMIWKSECKKNEELEEQRSRRVERKGKVKGKGREIGIREMMKRKNCLLGRERKINEEEAIRGGEIYSADKPFLQQCLMPTCLVLHTKALVSYAEGCGGRGAGGGAGGGARREGMGRGRAGVSHPFYSSIIHRTARLICVQEERLPA